VKTLASAAVLIIVLASAGSALAADVNWDGTWSGKLGRQDPWPVTVVIAGGKVVSFTERGVAFGVSFSKVKPNAVVFGDKVNYQVKLKKTGADAAAGEVHGRLGAGPAQLTRS
jgi:hypothetical protein